MRSFVSFLLITFICIYICLVGGLSNAAVPMRTEAAQAIVVDYETGNVLFEKNADRRIPTASMSKALTLYITFEALASKQLGLDDTLPVSAKARNMGGSRMFVEQGTRVRVEDLIKGISVQSGNDACIVLAQGIAGSEKAFVRLINELAAQLQMTSSHFENATGWPNPQHYSTMRDLSKLGMAIIRDFPQYYHYFSIKKFTYNNITQDNRNPLLYRDGLNADGVKTGHTNEAGYGLIGSGVDPDTGRRVVIVASGMSSSHARAVVGSRLLEWGLANFENRRFFRAEQEIASVPVADGKQSSVALTSHQDVIATLPKSAKNVKISVNFLSPLVAPISKGDEVASLNISWDDGQNEGKLQLPLFATRDVKRSGFIGKTFGKALRLIGF